MQFSSKLPHTGTTIFTIMSALAAEHNAINLSQGFPNFPTDPRLNELVYQYMKEGYNQYAPMAGVPALREILSHKIDRLFNFKPEPATEITVTAGAAQGLFTAIAAFVHPGDEVIILEPAYDLYRPAIEVYGGIPVAYELKAPSYAVDWDEFAQLITPKTRMILINTPHNPTGSILRKADLERLDALTADTNIIVLSDEVYEHLIYEGEEHQSVLRFPQLRERSLAVYSFGKTFHATGWRIGYCVGPAKLMAEFRKIHQFNVFSVNTPMQYALAKYLEDENTYRYLASFFEKKRDFFLSTMAGSRLLPLHCDGTYFHLFDYSSISQEPDTAFARRLTTEFGVAAIPVSVFYADGRDDKIIRLCFAKTEDMLEEAGALLQKV